MTTIAESKDINCYNCDYYGGVGETWDGGFICYERQIDLPGDEEVINGFPKGCRLSDKEKIKVTKK